MKDNKYLIEFKSTLKEPIEQHSITLRKDLIFGLEKYKHMGEPSRPPNFDFGLCVFFTMPGAHESKPS